MAVTTTTTTAVADPASHERDAVLDRYSRHVNKALASLCRLVGAPVEVRSAGTKVYGGNGDEYLDCGGFGVFLLGHCHPKVVSAVRRQLEEHPLATRLFLNPQLAEAAEALASVAPAGLEHVFLTNSGAEAVEVGLKLARLAGKTRIVAMEGGFHGKTLGALSVTGRPQYQRPFAPLLPGIDFVPFGDASALQAAIGDQGGHTAVILEPVQAEGGVRMPPPGYLAQVHQQCRETGATLILDEIQTGLGRLGAWWGADIEGITPDVLLTGKILGGGVMPVGGVVATAELFAPLNDDPMLHSSTFAGSPLAAAAVSATIAVIRDEGLVERSESLGATVLQLASDAVTTHCPHLVREVRGRGLLVGIDFVSEEAATEFMIGLLERHVIPSYSLNSHHVLRLTPPALLDEADLRWLEDALVSAARTLGGSSWLAASPDVPTLEEMPCAVSNSN
ncbi:MAG TPA: aminotransferase class III-fold pyridoxal phosphate-dependent enzyme [Acidimicrobiales bacterium]|nr:aminotransferase class III-fold pyridoxal phosphate-dependent enzyme [Acidimicrobiales bacterium]